MTLNTNHISDSSYGSHSGTQPLRNAFTLIEVLVVITIVSLLASVALLSVSVPLRRARVDSIISRIRSMDANTRVRCRSGAEAKLLIDARKGEFLLTGFQTHGLGQRLIMPNGTTIHRVRGLRKHGDLQYTVEYTSFGTSQTFAVEIGQRDGFREWLLFLGLTGQAYVVDDSGTVDEVFRREHSSSIEQATMSK